MAFFFLISRGRASTLFYMYLTFTILVVVTFFVNMILYSRIKKYSLITFMTHKEETRFRYT